MSEILQINVTGQDQSGLTTEITSVMSDCGLEVVDINLSVIQGILNWGMIARVPEGQDAALLLKDLQTRLHDYPLQFDYQPLTMEGYDSKIRAQENKTYLLTLLSRKITTEHIARVASIVARHGLNIDRVSPLSDLPELSSKQSGSVSSCLEFAVQGLTPDLEELRAEFLRISESMAIDVVFQEDNVFRRNRRLVVFDMDSTLIEAEVIDLLADAAGVGDKVAAITERAMQGELDFNESFRERVAMLKGLDESVLEAIAKKLPITEGAERLISSLNALGYTTAILSGGFTYFARYLQKELGVHHIFANELDIVDGKVTGEVKGTIVNGEQKAELLETLAEKQRITLEQTIAVGDGANDLPMLGKAGLGVAFRAKPLVKQKARQSISTLGLDSMLYLMGFTDKDIKALNR